MTDRSADIARGLAVHPAAQGYLVVRGDRGERSYMLGPRTQLDDSPPMLDWRTAPLAAAFFAAAPGEPYELESGAELHVVERWLVQRGGLVGDTAAIDAHGTTRAIARPAPAKIPQPDRDAL